MSTLVCSDCGFENPLAAERCQKCGALLEDVAAEEILPPSQSAHDDFDPMTPADDDLPGLLNALKQNGDIGTGEGYLSGEQPLVSSASEDIFDSDAPDENEDIPEWLQRIRSRASEEADSIGEITQKISAARQSLSDEQGSGQHENFQSWLNSIRDQKGIKEDETPSGDVDLLADPANGTDTTDSTEVSNGGSDWLSKIRKGRGKLPHDDIQEPSSLDREGDSLLQWLVALEDGDGQLTQYSEEFTDKKAPLVEKTRQTVINHQAPGDEIKQQTSTEALKSADIKKPVLSVSRSEKTQADQLSATIVDERTSRPIREPSSGSSNRLLRLIFGVLVIAGLSLSLFINNDVLLPQEHLQPHHRALLSWAEELPPRASLLLVFDYQAGFNHELTLVAKPILEKAIQADGEISILASTASGVLLSRRQLGGLEQAESLLINDLGYFPVPAYGAYRLANHTLPDWQIPDLPEPIKVLPPGEFDGILILSDTYEGARTWVEQLSALTPGTPLNLILTAQAGPLMMPYFDSGQVIGTLMLIATLVIGALIATDWVGNDEGTGPE